MRFPRILSALLLASTLGACHSYQPVTAPLPEYVAAHDGRNEMRLTLVSGERVLLEDTYVAGGSLYGYPKDAPSAGSALVEVPLDAIQQAHLRKPHASKSVGYVVGGALIAGTVAASASLFGSVRK
jgi:hypothetical protein